MFDQDHYIKGIQDFDYYFNSGLNDISKTKDWLAEHHQNRFFIMLIDMQMHYPYVPDDATILKFTDSIQKKGINSYKQLEENALLSIIDKPLLIFKEDAVKKYSAALAGLKKTKDTEALKKMIQHPSENIVDPLPAVSDLKMPLAVLVINQFFDSFDLENNEDLEYLRLLYKAKAHDLDRSFGKLIDYLKKQDILDKSTVIFTAAHGEDLFQTEGGIAPRNLVKNVLHVPLIIRLPHSFMKGKKLNKLCGTIDIMTTALRLLSVKAPVNQGIDLFKKDILKTRDIFSEHYEQYRISALHLYSIIHKEYEYEANFRSEDRILRPDGKYEKLFKFTPDGDIDITYKDTGIKKKLKNRLIKSYRDMEKELWGTLTPVFTFAPADKKNEDKP